MSIRYDSTPRALSDDSNVARTLGVASLGGSIIARVVIDDTVITSKDSALRHLRTILDAVTKNTWPGA